MLKLNNVVCLAIMAALLLVHLTCDAGTQEDMPPVVIAADGHIVQAGERPREPLNWRTVYGTDEGLECNGGDK